MLKDEQRGFLGKVISSTFCDIEFWSFDCVEFKYF